MTLWPSQDQVRVETSSKLLLCLACGAALSAAVGWHGYQNPPAGTEPFRDSLRFALRLTARASFAFWFLTFVAGPLATIQPAAAASLLRWRPRLGLVFAGAHLVHMSLVLTIPLMTHTNYPNFIIFFGGVGAVVAGIMALTSFPTVRRHLSLRAWKLLHRSGIWYVGIMFSYGLLWRPMQESSFADPLYWPFLIAIATALALHGWRAHVLSGVGSARGVPT